MDKNRRKMFSDLKNEICTAVEFQKHVIEYWGDETQYEVYTMDFSNTPDYGHYAFCFTQLIEKDEEEGVIAPGKTTIVETTSGTAGRGLAFVARQLGYSVKIFMPVPLHRKRLEALQGMLEWDANSEIVQTPTMHYVAGAVDKLRQFFDTAIKTQPSNKVRKFHLLNHSRRDESLDAFSDIIKKSWEALEVDDIEVPIVVAALGGGCFSTPWFSFFKNEFCDIQTLGVEPMEAPVSWVNAHGKEKFRSRYGREPTFKPHALPGTAGWDVDFPLLKLKDVDDIILVEKENVDKAFEEINGQNGFNFGRSACACALAGIEANDKAKPRTIIMPIYDRADLYGDEDAA